MVGQHRYLTPGAILDSESTWLATQTYADGILLRLGTDGDIASVLRAAVLSANTALTGVLVGTPVTLAMPANTFMLSNITANGDIVLAVNNGGHSLEGLRIDASAKEVILGHGGLKIVSADATDATSTTTGALKTAGGLGVAKKAYFGDAIEVDDQIKLIATGDGTNKNPIISAENKHDVTTSALIVLTGSYGAGGLAIVKGRKTTSAFDKFCDLVIIVQGGDTPVVAQSGTVSGSPDARTYTMVSNDLKLAMASNTYDVNVIALESPAAT